MRASAKPTNANRILNKSLQLFNEFGVQKVTHRDISGALDISPGNLTYHFKKKPDIVHSLVDQLESELTEIMGKVPAASENMMAAQADFMLELLRVIWDYRFFSNNIRYLSQLDRSLKTRFNALRANLIRETVSAYEELERQGAVKKVESPNSIELVVENTWYLWLSLIHLYEVVTPSRPSRRGFFRFAFDHVYSILEPHYTDRVKTGFYDYARTQMG